MGPFSGGMVAGPCSVVTTLVGGLRVVHGITLTYVAGKRSLGWIVGVTIGCGGVMASHKLQLVATGPPDCGWSIL